ncbi:serine protease [Actinomycetospora endophytica]|uniref:Serine protease n=1 Tax=Actinomycetospora endophytica TaxID=2291215 RepID=A0ABS8PAK3_9PSEU|nr:serine protease [Actinomycetospora endophytica]MCD2195295.1 serine protease [Actinomycetospora endophytica]
MEQNSAVVRVCTPDGVAVGSGVLLTPSLVATCAHVVATTLAHDELPVAPPPDAIRIDFPFLAVGTRRTGTVRRWEPPRADGAGDVALLDLDAPVPAPVPPWARPDRPWGAEFRVMGFPLGREDGVWSAGTLRAMQGSGWLQLAADHGPRIGPGFSGAPVWDGEGASVLGLAVTADRLSHEGVAYALPADEVLALAPELLVNPFPGDDAFTAEQHDRFFGRESDLERCLGVLDRHGIVVITAGSGQGATSLLYAGVVAASSDLVVADRLDLRPDAAQWVRRQRETGNRVVATARADRWPAVVGNDEGLRAATIAIGNLDRESLRRTILCPPASRPGPAVSPALAARLVDDAGDEPGGLALLQHLMHRLWDAPGTTLSVADTAVALAEQTWAGFDAANRLVARELLLGLVRPAGDGFDRGELALDGLGEAQREVLEKLAAARVVTIGRGGSDVAELAHRALVDRWPLLAGRLTADASFLRWRDGARTRAAAWRDAADPAALLRGDDLGRAREFLEQRDDDVDAPIRALVAASARRRRRDRRRRLLLTAVVLVLVLVAGALTTTVVRARVAAARETANAETLGRLALAAEATDPPRATQLALAAYRSDPADATARTALGQAYLLRRSTTNVIPVPGTDEPGTILVPDPDQEYTVVVTPQGSGLAERLSTNAPLFSAIPGSDADARPVAVTGGGRWVVIRTGAGGVRVWDRTSSAGARDVPGPPATAVVPTPDGAHLLTYGPDGTGTVVTGVDLATFTTTTVARLPDAGISVWPTSDPTRLLVRAADGALTVRDTSGAVVGTAPADTGIALRGAVTVRCDTDPDQTVIVTDAATGLVRTRVPTGPHGCAGRPSTITADGAHLVWIESTPGASGIQPIQIVDLPDGRRRAAWVPAASPVLPPAAGPGIPVNPRFVLRPRDGELIDHGHVDGLNPLESPGWRAPTGPPAALLKGPNDGATVIADPTGATAINSFEYSVLGHLAAPTGGWSSTSVSAAGTFLAVGGGPSGTVVSEFALPDFRPLGTYALPVPAGIPVTLARGPDDLVVLGGGTLSWWSASTHRLLAPPVRTDAGTALNPTLAVAPDAATVALRVPTGVDLLSRSSPTPTAVQGSPGTSDGLLVDQQRLVSLDAPDQLVDHRVRDGKAGARIAVPPGTDAILGSDTAGRSLTSDPAQARVDVWDVDARQADGELHLPPGTVPSRLVGGRTELDSGDFAFSVAVDAEQWRTRLCLVQNEEFDPAELRLLPEGTPSNRPCSLKDE